MSKIKIADLERIPESVAEVSLDWCELAALLRLARAAKDYMRGGRLDSHLTRGPKLLEALDAFDFGDA